MREEGISFETTVHLTAEDYKHFTLYQGRWQSLGLYLFYVCVIVLGTYLSGADERSVLLSIPLGMVVAGALIVYSRWRIGQRVGKLFASDRVLQLDQRIHLNEGGIHHETGASSLDAKWLDVFKAVDSGKAYLIFLAKNKAIVIPKREVADEKQLEQLLKSFLPAAKLKLRR